MRLSAKQFQFVDRQFRHTHEPLNYCLHLLPILWKRQAQDKESQCLKVEQSKYQVRPFEISLEFF